MGESRQIGLAAPPDSTTADDVALAAFASQTLVVIPAHNEQACVGKVVENLRSRGFQHLRVVDNGSQDSTAAVAEQAGASVIRHPQTGYGLACWLGAQEVPEHLSWILYCNADASDDLEAYAQFAALSADHDLILGARTHPDDRRSMSLPQRFGNWLAPALIAAFWGRRFADLGPQRAIRIAALRGLDMQDRGFGWTVEMQVRAVEEGLRIAEIPVRHHPRRAGVSKISGNFRGSLAAGRIILQTLGKLAWRRNCARGGHPIPETFKPQNS